MMQVFRFLAVMVAALSLQGCWFVFIPGSVMGAVSDGITGAKGQHCVGANAKAGDLVKMPDGSVWKVVSTSGTSTRCQDSRIPIRAELAPAT